MNNNILCHIVGINNLLKSKFIKELNDKYSDLCFCDLDMITNDIRNGRKIVSLINNIEKTKKNPSKKRELVNELNNYWKNTLTNKLNNFIKNNNNKTIIILGLSTFHRNHRIKVNIDTNKKFFLKNNIKINAKEIVEYNLKKYKKYIIDGIFPIKYLDHEFLIDQREKLIKIYQNMNYVMKTYATLLKWFELMLKDNLKTNKTNVKPNPEKKQEPNKKNNYQTGGKIDNLLMTTESSVVSKPIWVGSSNEFYEVLEPKFGELSEKKKSKRRSRQNIEIFIKNKMTEQENNNYISGYNEQWLALMSIIKNNNNLFRKGYIENKNGNSKDKYVPYIEEKVTGASEFLKTSGFLYETKRSDFDTKVSQYKYKTNNPINFIDMKKIDNIYENLKKLGVKIINFK